MKENLLVSKSAYGLYRWSCQWQRRFLLASLLFAVSLLSGLQTAAQALPPFYNSNVAGTANSFPLNSATSNKVQWVYGPNLFASGGTGSGTSAYAGNITSVWFKLGTSGTAGATLANFTIKLGQNVGTLTSWPDGVFETNLTTVFTQTSYVLPNAVLGQWVEIPLQTPFPYNPTLSLVFEMSVSSSSGPTMAQVNTTGMNQRKYGLFSATSGTAGTGLVQFGLSLVPSTPCSGTPTAGTAASSAASACTGSDFTLSLNGATVATGITYQWQSSPDGVSGWTNIPGGTFAFFTTSQMATTFYRAQVVCSGGTPVTSNVVQVTTPGLFPAGTYTINSALPTGGTNFNSFNAAVDAISCGIAGAVTFNVVAGSGPYTEQVEIPQIFGASATSRITFNGNGETITFASANTNARHVIKLDGADYVTINNLVVNASTGTFGWGIHLTNQADYNEITNNTITAGNSATSSNFGALIASGSNTGATTSGNSANYTLIQGNTIIGGYYAFTLMGASTASPSVGNQIINNTVQDAYFYHMYLYYQDGLVVRGNDVSRPSHTSLTTFYGIYMVGHSGLLVEKNKVHDPFVTNTSSTSVAYGIYLSSSNIATGPQNQIRNNLVYNMESNGTIYAIYNSASGGTNYYHNTVSLDHIASTAGTAYGFYQVTNPANTLEIKNNIFSVTRGGSGTKYVLYFSSGGNNIASDYNVLYLNALGGTSHIGYNSANRTTLANWQAQGYDANSSGENPMFVNAAAGDFTPTNAAINNMGTPVGVTDDILGNPRSATTPDPGAYEFSVPPCAGMPTPGTATASVTSVCPGGNFQLLLTGFTIATGIDIQWQVSPSGLPGTFTNITGADASSYIANQLGTSYYRAQVTCNSANAAFSNVVQVTSPALFPAGTYTINSALPTGGTNFNSFTAAVNAIQCGIAGAVTFNVVAGSGPYNEQISIPQVFGASATSRITFNGNGETIGFASGNTDARHVIKLDGADYVTINDLVINANTGTFGWGIHLTNGADYNEITNNIINSSTTSTSTNFGGLIASGSNTAATTSGNSANYTLVQGNTIRGGYYTVTMMGSGTTDYATGNQLINNTVEDAYFYHMYLYYQDGLVVRGNDVSRPTRTNLTTFYGIYMVYQSGLLAEKNKVHDPFTTNTSATSVFYGIYLSSSNIATGPENQIRNNLIYNVNSNGTIYAIYNSASGGTNYYHNTVSLDNTASTAGTTYAFYQVTNPASELKIKNNIFSVTRGGSGTKYVLYFSSGGANVTSSNNILYLNAVGGTSHIGYNSANRTTLGDWQAQGFDSGSLNTNPMFNSPATGDFTPTSQFADNIGTPVGVTDDILGAARSTIIPDPGAYEFSVFVACPAPAGITATINNSVSATISWVVVNNPPIEFNLIYGPVGFDPLSGGTPVSALSASPYTIAGLTPGTCYEVYIEQDCGVAGMSVLSGPVQFCMPPCSVATITGANSFCFSGTPALSLPGTTQQGTFQWMSSSSATGPFTNISGATADTYTASAPITTTTYYQAVVDCGLGPQTTPVYEVTIFDPTITSTNSPVTLCAPGVATLTATASAGDVKWFDVATGGTALATGNTYTPNVTASTTYYAAASTGTPANSLTTTMAAGNGQEGNMFPITALNTVTITAFSGYANQGTGTWTVWYRPDNYLNVPGANTSNAGWTLIGTSAPVVTAPAGTPTLIPLPINITIPSGSTYSFQVVSSLSVQYTNGTTLGAVFASNSDIQFLEGHGGTAFGMTFAPRIFNGVIHYGSGCESPRVPVQVNVTPASPITVTASASTICEGESVTLSVDNPVSGATYAWTGSLAGSSITVSPTATTTIDVTSTETSGCTATASASITVNPTPVATVGSNSPVGAGGTIMLSSSGGTSYNWTGPNGFTSTDQNPQILNATAVNEGSYCVTVTNAAGCSTTVCTTVAVNTPQPLSGTYTINQTAPASATNFISFPSAANWLNTYGVSGPVTINVVAGTSPYLTQQFLLGEIPGTSATNTVTINGNGETLTYCTSSSVAGVRAAIRLDGTDYLRLNNLVINATCPFGWGIHLMNGADNNIFTGNTINASLTSQSLSATAGFVAANSMIDPQALGNAANNLQLINNTINGGYNGIRVNGALAARSTGLVMTGNTINNTYEYGVYVIAQDGAQISQNQITMRAGNPRSVGMVVQYIDNALMLTRNKVSQAGAQGLYLNQIHQASTTRGLVANNMIGGGFQGTTQVFAVQLNFASHLDVYFNSTWADNGATGAGFYMSNIHSQQVKLMNNSFAYTGPGSGYAMQANNGNTNFIELNYNNYYSTGVKFVRYANADRQNLVELRGAPGLAGHDMQSMSANPLYTSASDLHIQSGSPLIGQGTSVASVTVDFDGQTRPAAPAIGADELGTGPRIAAAADLDAQVYPNPFAQNLTVQLASADAGQVQLIMTDMMGRQVYNRSFATAAGANTLQVQIDEQLAQGVYLLQVRQGETSGSFRVVKH